MNSTSVRPHEAVGADARRDRAEQGVHEVAQLGPHLRFGEARPDEPHPVAPVPVGMQRAARTMPGRQATFVTWSKTPRSICASRVSEA